MNSKDIKALIEDLLHNPDFHAEEVDADMLQRFANSIDSGDLDIISMHLEGDGAQKLELFKRPAEKVLRELISDTRLAGYQLALLPILKASACTETDKDWLVHGCLDLYHCSTDHVIADLNE